jgi:hypothetical protein
VDRPGGAAVSAEGDNSVDNEHRSFWTNPWVIGIGAPLIVASILAVVHGIGSPAPHPSPTPRPPATTPPKGPSATPPGTPVTPVWSGPVGITFSGIDFDSNPPGPGPDNITWERYTYTLQGYGSVIVSRYPSSGARPTEATCRSWARAHNSQILSGVNRGDQLCFITQDGRSVRLIVTNISSDAVEGQATVWNDGNQ